jgi:glycogen debranching enzyme
MQEPADSDDPFYILATGPRAVVAGPVLKHGDTFAVFDTHGDMVFAGDGEHGLYHDGTRFLSRLLLLVARKRPLLLSSGVVDHNEVFRADLTNPDIAAEGHVVLARDVLHVARCRLLRDAACHERLQLASFKNQPISIELRLDFDADFADIFEVRGTPRPRRGEALKRIVGESGVDLPYRGLDGVLRTTCIRWSLPPRQVSGRAVCFDLTLPPRETTTLDLTITCTSSDAPAAPVQGFDGALHAMLVRHASDREAYCEVASSNADFDGWIRRSLADVQMMCTDTPFGPYPYAGVPWYNTVFGRDGIVTALELLWVNPRIARGVLGCLASLQATSMDPEADAQPGKILHEARGGEMANRGEVPFRRYYGSVDATPLFIVLASEYYKRTDDLDFVRTLWPNIEAALAWIERHGDADGDGFVEYARFSRSGLVNQGWKDSHDAVLHADGSPVQPPIALCEVQAYVYEARRGAARLAAALDRPATAVAQEEKAEALRDRFEQAFWCDELSTYGLALDGDKRLCRVRASNAGHCLFGGIAAPERARKVAAQLLGADFFSGWGIRTLAASEPRYNPMSYHNGSVWPHDNALIAAGMSRYGLTSSTLTVTRGLFEASRFIGSRRLPELFCGFARRPGEPPTLYPVACSPQAWSAGAPFMLLQACLGLSIDARRGRIVLDRAALPGAVHEITLKNLVIAKDRTLDLLLERHADGVGMTVLRRDPDIEIVELK